MALAAVCVAGALATLARRLCARRPGAYRRVAWRWAFLVYACMIAQEYALFRDGMLTLRTGLPLHLCSFSGCFLSVPALLCRRGAVYDFYLCLSAPSAALALVFPAIAETATPVLTECTFCLMHALLFFIPIVKGGDGRAASRGVSVGGVLSIACLLLVLATFANRAFDANYLFLSAPPLSTPLALLDGLSALGRALIYIALALLATQILRAVRVVKERITHEKKNWYTDQRGRLPGTQRSDPRGGEGGV